MLPPIEDSILQSNPKFAALHASLTKTILNPSGSTKHAGPAQKERDVVSEKYRAARIKAARAHLLRTALSNLDLSPPPSNSISKRDSKSRSTSTEPTQSHKPLPAELVELIILLSARLANPSLPASSTKLLESTDQYHSLPTHLPQIGALVSNHLHAQALALARIVSPTTNPSFLHRGIPKLVSHAQDLQAQIGEKRADLERRRMELVSKTTTLLGIYHLTISLIIGILEQSKHGAVARHVKSKAEFLSVQAKTVELEVKEKGVRGNKMVYTEEVKKSLERYVGNLRDGRERLKERKGDAERVLWGYGIGREEGDKDRVMKSIAQAYGELQRELREVGRDVERLRGK